MTTLEVIFGIIFISVAVVMFVPGVKTELVKAAATTSIGKKLYPGWEARRMQTAY